MARKDEKTICQQMQVSSLNSKLQIFFMQVVIIFWGMLHCGLQLHRSGRMAAVPGWAVHEPLADKGAVVGSETWTNMQTTFDEILI